MKHYIKAILIMIGLIILIVMVVIGVNRLLDKIEEPQDYNLEKDSIENSYTKIYGVVISVNEWNKIKQIENYCLQCKGDNCEEIEKKLKKFLGSGALELQKLVKKNPYFTRNHKIL